MSNIYIDITPEMDIARIAFSAPTECEVLTDALHTVLHLLRASKMEAVDTKQFNSFVETACELKDTIQRMLEDNAVHAAEVKVAAGVSTPTAAKVKDESIEDTLRDIIGYCILFLHHTK